MGYLNHYELQDLKFNLRGCLQKTWSKLKEFIEFIGEYDLYNGRKWDDYI